MAADLAGIRTKVRRLTQNPSVNQLSNADLDDYINTFILYDFPEQIRAFRMHSTFTFVTSPGQDVYPTDIISFVGNVTNPLYDFQNKYLTVNPPVYIAGYQSLYCQSREQFFGIYPKVNSIAQLPISGNGVQTNFTGVVNTNQATLLPNQQQFVSLLQNEVLFASKDPFGVGISLIDVPLTDSATGYKVPIGNLYVPNNLPALPPQYPADLIPTNTINYLTGVFNLTFPFAPANGAPITSQTCPQNLALPQALLFYENKFTVRPVPDQPYRVQFEVYPRPTALIAANQIPELEEYWQYIAYGAAKKIFEDKSDIDSVQQLMPEFKTQERLVLRRTLVQQTTQRAPTIYSEQVNNISNNGWWGWGGSNN